MEIKVVDVNCKCGGELHEFQLARTHDEHLFVVGSCEVCEKKIAVELDQIIASLYQTPLVLVKSNKVN